MQLNIWTESCKNYGTEGWIPQCYRMSKSVKCHFIVVRYCMHYMYYGRWKRTHILYDFTHCWYDAEFWMAPHQRGGYLRQLLWTNLLLFYSNFFLLRCKIVHFWNLTFNSSSFFNMDFMCFLDICSSKAIFLQLWHGFRFIPSLYFPNNFWWKSFKCYLCKGFLTIVDWWASVTRKPDNFWDVENWSNIRLIKRRK